MRTEQVPAQVPVAWPPLAQLERRLQPLTSLLSPLQVFLLRLRRQQLLQQLPQQHPRAAAAYSSFRPPFGQKRHEHPKLLVCQLDQDDAARKMTRTTEKRTVSWLQ
jgi:hypothetical protein